MPRLTERDEWLLDWFGVVRLSNMEGLRWAMLSTITVRDDTAVNDGGIAAEL